MDVGFNLGYEPSKSYLFYSILIYGIVLFVFLDWCLILIH